MAAPLVIIGTGLAGYNLAREVRRLDAHKPLLLITAAVGVSIAMRSPFKVDIVRDRSTLARLVDDGWVENVRVALPWFVPVTKMNSARPPTVVAVLDEVC